jgi:hypothetical protein
MINIPPLLFVWSDCFSVKLAQAHLLQNPQPVSMKHGLPSTALSVAAKLRGRWQIVAKFTIKVRNG